MDDHAYDALLSYGMVDAIQPLAREMEEEGLPMSKCFYYQRAKDLVRCLNIMAPYAGYKKTTIKKLLEEKDCY